MKKLYLSLILGLLSFSFTATADFVEGENAFNNQQYAQAFSEFMPLAEKGDFRSQYYIGYLYLNGYGVQKNEKKALDYLQRATDQNYDLAQSLMAYLYAEGKLVSKDKKKSLLLYQKAADQGNVSALLNLGILYYTGDGVDKNVNKALDYFNKVPLVQKPIVGRHLGDIYANEGGFTDYNKAISYYRQGAQLNDLGSYHALAQMYQKGQGVTASISDAIKYYQYAASQNYAPSQYILGVIYANGEGVSRDKFVAYAWLSLAANQQLKVAEEARNKLVGTMSLTDIEKGRRKLIEIQQDTIGKISPPFSKTSVENATSTSQVNTAPRRRARRRRR